MAASDEDLVARVVGSDDRHAFAELVRRHQSAVRTLLRRLCRSDAALADDLAQETFVKAWRGLAGFTGSARLSTWLHRIAWNAWASHARRRPAPEPPPPDPRREADAVLDHRDLERALASLRDEERAAIALAYAEGLTHEEAAEILGWPLGTLKTHVARGKEKLRRLLDAEAEVTP